MKFSLILCMIATLVLVVTADKACDDEALKFAKEMLCLDKPLLNQIRDCKDKVTKLSWFKIARQRCGTPTLSAEDLNKIDACVSKAKEGLSTDFLKECTKKANSGPRVRIDIVKD